MANNNILSPITLLVTAATLAPLVSSYTPFGYQSDSTQSVEYRNNPTDPSDPNPTDPSSYTGSIHYDPLHHALYLTGATYASSVFDGVDVYGLTTEEAEELNDEVANNDGYWWEDMATGLKPHLMDVGVPEFGAGKGDCFYAVMGLPSDDDDKYMGTKPKSGDDNDSNKVKLVHSRRFGSEQALEACSAMDILFPSPKALEAGGYVHDFQHTNHPTVSPARNTGPQTRFRALEEEHPSLRRNTEIVPKEQTRPKQQEQQQRSMLTAPNVPSIQTRSVRLLMAGHVESPTKQNGYIISDLPNGHFNTAKVYAFAQQVDIRLPLGDIEPSKPNTATTTNMIHQGEHNGELDYDLHHYSEEEEELAQDKDEDWQSSPHKYDFDKIVTSGVESRAVLNDMLLPDLETVYPVSMVADPTSKKHYYVVLLAGSSDQFNPAGYNDDLANNLYLHRDPTIGEGASQRSWTDYDRTGINADLDRDNFGQKGRPNYGSDYRIIVKKMTIESVDATELTDSEEELAATSHEGELIAMRHTWMQEFRPDSDEDVRPAGLLFAPSGDAHGIGDVLIMVGTTGGRGPAFGTASETKNDGGAPQREDLDGFVTKIRADTGAFAGRAYDFDVLTNSFANDVSTRIRSNPGQDDIVSGVCAKPLRAVGKQDEMDYVYVVGSTSALLPAIPSGVRNGEFVAQYPEKVGEDDAMEAFLMKIDLSTMNTVWTVQVGAIINDGEKVKGNAFGYGCAVTRDGQDVYLTGLVKENGVVTDFSEEDSQDYQNDNHAEGGTDIFVASYKTSSGSRNFLKQVGSTMDDFPSRGNGGITTDRIGNAIVTGNTRGSLMRERDEGEYRYGQSGKDAASDIFVMSFDRASMDHLPIMSDGVGASRPEPTPDVPSPLPVNPPAPKPEPIPVDPTLSQEAAQKKNGALAGSVTAILAFVLLAGVGFALVVYRVKDNMKIKERNVLMDNTDNLHGQRQGANMQRRRRSTWGLHRATSTTMQDFEDLNIMVEVRNSASGGWHGVYDDEQLQAIDFGAPSGNSDDVVEQSLFMEDGLQEIEDNLDNFEIGDMEHMEEVSDEDLIKAYNDAMALDAELENPDIEFAMQGIGSEPALPDVNRDIS